MGHYTIIRMTLKLSHALTPTIIQHVAILVRDAARILGCLTIVMADVFGVLWPIWLLNNGANQCRWYGILWSIRFLGDWARGSEGIVFRIVFWVVWLLTYGAKLLCKVLSPERRLPNRAHWISEK